MELWGWGRKNTADVNDEGQLLVKAVTVSPDHEATHKGDAYTMDIDNVTVGANGNTLALMENSSDKEMVVTGFHLAPNTDDEDQEIEVYIGGAFSYLAEGTAVVPANLHSGKSGGASGGVSESFYVSDGTADTLTTITAGTIAGRFAMPNNVPYDCSVPGGWHIHPGNCFYLTATKDEKFRGFITFYYKDE